jgi:hypothetical protein
VSGRKIRTIIPAPQGWRHVSAQLARGYNREEGFPLSESEIALLRDDELFFIVTIVCFALVSVRYDYGEEHRVVEAVCASDWPQVLEPNQGEDGQGHIGYLAPGEEIDHGFRAEARDQIRAYGLSLAGKPS